MGRPAHFEIHASDPQAVQAFYEAVFGWSFRRWGEEPYWLIRTGNNPDLPWNEMDPSPGIDGGMQLREGPQPSEGQAVNAWVIVVEVDDAEDTVAKAQAAGGSVAIPLETVPEIGIVGYLKDPDGNLFGILQPPTES